MVGTSIATSSIDKRGPLSITATIATSGWGGGETAYSQAGMATVCS